MSAARTLPPVTLVTGDEELLVSRALAAVTRAARELDPDADVREYAAEALDPSALLDIATPSLFGELRVVVVRIGGGLADDVRDRLVDLVSSAEPGMHVVVVHPGGNAGKRVVDACKAAGARVVECGRIDKARDQLDFVSAEFAAAGCSVTDAGARALLDAVGGDLRELAAACAQLAADIGGTVDDTAVARYFRGRAEATGFVIADRAVEGNPSAALSELRFAFDIGLDAVLVTSALARQLRTVARVASAGRGAADAVARDLKLKPWMVDKARRQSRGWTPEMLVAAHAAVAFADAEVKGGGTAPDYAAERAVRLVADAAAGRR